MQRSIKQAIFSSPTRLYPLFPTCPSRPAMDYSWLIDESHLHEFINSTFDKNRNPAHGNAACPGSSWIMMSPISLNLSTHSKIFLPKSLITIISPLKVKFQGLSQLYKIPSILPQILSKLDLISCMLLSIPRLESVARSCGDNSPRAISHKDRVPL